MHEAGKILGNFRLVEKLAVGREGDLWQALDTRTDTEVAVKFMSPTILKDPQRLKRVTGLVERSAALHHPNIAAMHTLEHVDGICFTTMELICGTPISDLIPENGTSLEVFLERAIPLTDAIQAAHERDVLHGDIKPTNIVIDVGNKLYVLGFGLSEVADPNLGANPDEVPTLTISQDDLSLTTIPYVCPEMIKAKPIDQRSDLFSLGAVLYLMATGRPPFIGESPADVVVGILYDRPASIAEFNSLLPRRLGDSIFRCLEKEPSARFSSVKDLRVELGSL